MDTQFETQLRTSLRHGSYPEFSGARDRLLSFDFQPKAAHWSPKLTYGSLAGAAASVAVVVPLLVFGSSEPAFAGWSPTPTVPSLAQSSQAQVTCSPQGSGSVSTDSPVHSVLTDVRGPYTVSLYSSGSGSQTCFTGPGFDVMTGAVSLSASPTGAGTANILQSHSQLGDGSPYTLISGQVGSAASGVSLTLSTGEQVQATVANGWFEAWWPSADDAKTIQVTSPSGTSTTSLDLPANCPEAIPSTKCALTKGSPSSFPGSGPGTGESGLTVNGASVNGMAVNGSTSSSASGN
jgi:hypothetical protein